MPVFSLDIEKSIGLESWTNRYFVETSDFSSAVTLGQLFVDAERVFHTNVVTFDRYRIATITPNDDQFVITPLAVPGQRAPGGSLLALFNAVRVDFSKGFGRPYRKYYRGVLDEETVNFQGISGTLITLVENGLSNISGYNRTMDGTVLGTPVVIPQVAMRQLRRGSRRRTTPIL